MNLSKIDVDRRVTEFRFYKQTSPEAWHVFNDKLDLSWLFHDFAMDGKALSEQEISRALLGESGRHYSDTAFLNEIRHTHSGIKFTRSLALEPVDSLSLDAVKAFHAVLKDKNDPKGGRYRKASGPMVPYLHGITRPPSISYRLRKFVEDLDKISARHPIEGAALAHHEFMSIWPFDKSSATAGRLILNYALLSQGYPPAIVHATNRQAYYEALCGRPEKMIPVVFDAVAMTLSSASSFFVRYEECAA